MSAVFYFFRVYFRLLHHFTISLTVFSISLTEYPSSSSAFLWENSALAEEAVKDAFLPSLPGNHSEAGAMRLAALNGIQCFMGLRPSVLAAMFKSSCIV